jgi:hypothetical protein
MCLVTSTSTLTLKITISFDCAVEQGQETLQNNGVRQTGGFLCGKDFGGTIVSSNTQIGGNKLIGVQ